METTLGTKLGGTSPENSCSNRLRSVAEAVLFDLGGRCSGVLEGARAVADGEEAVTQALGGSPSGQSLSGSSCELATFIWDPAPAAETTETNLEITDDSGTVEFVVPDVFVEHTLEWVPSRVRPIPENDSGGLDVVRPRAGDGRTGHRGVVRRD